MNAEILVGPERRRRWSVEEKARIVAAASAPDTRVADIARRYGVSRSLIYTWRREARQGLLLDGSAGAALPELVPVIMSGASSDVAPPLAAREKHRSRTNGAAKPDGAIEIALPGDVRMTVRGIIEERTLRAVLGALRSA